jgi:hypothetical protein
MKPLLLTLSMLLATSACTEPTAIRVVAEIRGIEADQLRIEVTSPGELLLSTSAPETPSGPLESPTEVLLVLDDRIGDRVVDVDIAAMNANNVVATRRAHLPVVTGRVIRTSITLGDEQEECTGDGCAPQCRTCESENACATTIDDGCGNELTCGGCAAPDTCGGGGVAKQCGCTPTCDGKQCGDDGCGGDCGACGTSESGQQTSCEENICRVPNGAQCNPYFDTCHLGWLCINWICQMELH